MNSNENPGQDRLLAWVLGEQEEPLFEDDPVRSFSTERIRSALKGEQPFSKQEWAAVLRSPALRHRIRFTADVLQTERILQWRRAPVHRVLELQAAADDVVRPVTLSNPDFTLTLYPLDEAGAQWALQLRVGTTARALLGNGPVVVREDPGGQIWLEGSLNSSGELSGPWVGMGPPLEHLKSARLLIEPA